MSEGCEEQDGLLPGGQDSLGLEMKRESLGKALRGFGVYFKDHWK